MNELYIISMPIYLKSLGLRGPLSIYTFLSFVSDREAEFWKQRGFPKSLSDLRASLRAMRNWCLLSKGMDAVG